MAKFAADGLVPRDGSDRQTKPYLLLATAASYAKAAELAHDNDPEVLLAPVYLLTGFSVELSLKAYILQQTRDPARIQRHGHKLKDAWADARSLGLDLSNLILTPQDFDWVIEAFADHHQALTFRYMPDVKPFVMRITPGDMVKASQALAGAVLKHVPFPEGDVDTVA